MSLSDVPLRLIKLSLLRGLRLREQTAPDTPPSNHGELYVKDKAGTSALYFKDDAGSEIQLGAPFTGITVQEGDVTVSSVVTTIDFGTGFDVSEAPAGEANVTLDLSEKSTSDLPEGSNLYYTDERVDDRAAALIQNGTGITWSYNDGANTLTPTVTITQYTDEMAQDAVGTILTDSSSVDFTYNDGANTITAAVLPAGVDHNSLANLTTGDPHTQYRLEADNHSHQTSGAQAGTIDHGAALTGLTDDDHTQYALLAGRAGSQTLKGGTGAAEALILVATAGVGAGSESISMRFGNNGATTVHLFTPQSMTTNPVSGDATHLLAADGNCIFQAKAFGTSVNNTMQVVRGRGTAASPAAVQTNDLLGDLPDIYAQYDTTAGHVTECALIRTYASENHDSTHHGSGMQFWITPNAGSITQILGLTGGAITIAEATNLVLGSTTGTKIGTATTQKLGFFNSTPIVQGTAFTQTYSTATHTHANITASNPPAGGTGATAGAYDTAANRNLMITSLTNNIADVANVKQVLNGLIDDLQALGLIA